MPGDQNSSWTSIHQATNLVLRGAGKSTRIIITDPASGGFGFGLGQQVALRDLVLDYDPVPFCQGVIRAVDVETGSFELEVEEGYPTPDAENFLNAVEPILPTAAVEIDADVAQGEAGVRDSGLKTILAPEARPVIDRRATH